MYSKPSNSHSPSLANHWSRGEMWPSDGLIDLSRSCVQAWGWLVLRPLTNRVSVSVRMITEISELRPSEICWAARTGPASFSMSCLTASQRTLAVITRQILLPTRRGGPANARPPRGLQSVRVVIATAEHHFRAAEVVDIVEEGYFLVFRLRRGFDHDRDRAHILTSPLRDGNNG